MTKKWTRFFGQSATGIDRLKKWGAVLGALAILLLVLLAFSKAVFSQWTWLSPLVSVLLFIDLTLLLVLNRSALRSRSTAFGLSSLVTILLVFGLLGVANFLSARHSLKWDLTSSGLHTLGEQTEKVVKGLKEKVQATLWIKTVEREKYRTLLENYRSLNSLFEFEYADPDQEPTRAKAAGIKRYGTLQLKWEGKESKIDDPNEEKLTNALIKLTRRAKLVFCSTTGHGERTLSQATGDGLDALKKALEEQSIEWKELNLVTESKDGKVPSDCTVLGVIGPEKPFFSAELKILKDHSESGGKILLALDLPLKGTDPGVELVAFARQAGIEIQSSLVLDPLARMLGSDAAVPIVSSYDKEHPVTRDSKTQSYWPFARVVQAAANPSPSSTTKVTPLAMTSPQSFAISDLKALASGQVKVSPAKDRQSSYSVAAASENSKSKSRLVVLGTSQIVTNQWSRFGHNLDFFMNSVGWLLDDDSLITIRAKEDSSGKLELSSQAGNAIGLLTVLVLPLGIALLGGWVWWRRKKM